MEYQSIMDALDMIWDEKPRLDIRACRDEAYNLLDVVLENFSEYIWNTFNEDQPDLLNDLAEEEHDVIVDTVADAVGFGVDLYLGCVLATQGKLTATGQKPADPEQVFAALELKELHVQIIERFDLVPLILRDYSMDLMESLTEEITGFSGFPWSQLESLRQILLATATTCFILSTIHLENLYGFSSNQ